MWKSYNVFLRNGELLLSGRSLYLTLQIPLLQLFADKLPPAIPSFLSFRRAIVDGSRYLAVSQLRILSWLLIRHVNWIPGIRMGVRRCVNRAGPHGLFLVLRTYFILCDTRRREIVTKRERERERVWKERREDENDCRKKEGKRGW